MRGTHAKRVEWDEIANDVALKLIPVRPSWTVATTLE